MRIEPVPARTSTAAPTRADFRALNALAAPIVVAQVGLMAMGVVDTIFVGHVSAADLAATALGNIYVFGVCVFGMGVVMALDPLVSQAVGAQDSTAVSRALQRGVVLSLALSIPATLLFIPADAILRLLGQPADVVPKAAAFVRVSIPGALAFFLFVTLRQGLICMGHTRPVVVTVLLANLANALLCWAMVFGHVHPDLRGAVGAGVATMLARWSMVVMVMGFGWRALNPHLFPFRRDALLPGPLARMLRIGAPIGVQYELEFGVFAVVALLMGRLGTVPMAAHQVAMNIASLTFMVPLGVSSAAAVLVGRAVGAGDPGLARRSAVAALISGFVFMAGCGLLLGFLPGPLARVYTSDPAVVALAVLLIPVAGVFQVFDGTQIVSIGILRGVGDTRTPMIVNVLGFWLVGLPVSLWLGFGVGGGPIGLWWGLVAGLAIVATFLVIRVRARMRGELRRIGVDVPGVHTPDVPPL